jgi:dihydroorotate dehydrogenase
LSAFYRELADDIPIISVGGIDSAEEAKLRIELGAKLVQIYTGLIYKGPGLVRDIARALASP